MFSANGPPDQYHVPLPPRINVRRSNRTPVTRHLDILAPVLLLKPAFVELRTAARQFVHTIMGKGSEITNRWKNDDWLNDDWL